MSHLINRTHVKKLALDYAAANRARRANGEPWFTRVSADFLDRIEAATAEAVRREVVVSLAVHPSSGKTLK